MFVLLKFSLKIPLNGLKGRENSKTIPKIGEQEKSFQIQKSFRTFVLGETFLVIFKKNFSGKRTLRKINIGRQYQPFPQLIFLTTLKSTFIIYILYILLLYYCVSINICHLLMEKFFSSLSC